MTTQWRASGPFITSSALFSGMLEETQLFLRTYAEQTGSTEQRVDSAKQLLVDTRLPQRARSTRVSIIHRISVRLTSWNPPEWVLCDLAHFADDSSPLALQAALLLHVCRQDQLLYALVHEVVIPMWREGQAAIDSTDVHRYLDAQVPQHPEIETWTRQTRARLSSTTLAILRDYGLLQGKSRKVIVEPIVPGPVVGHAIRLLEAEGLSQREILTHPDWGLWLWNEQRTQSALSGLPTR